MTSGLRSFSIFHTHTHTHIHTHIHIYIYIYICVCVYIDACMCVYVREISVQVKWFSVSSNNQYIYSFGLVSFFLFNGISIFVGYLMPKPFS